MKVLVTGANGQLGLSLKALLSAEGTTPSVTEKKAGVPSGVSPSASFVPLFTDVTHGAEYLDITDMAAIREMVRKEGIEAIVNCAAYTNVEAAEDNEELAELLNAKAVENLAVAMKEVGGLLVHISTDYVFGGEAYNTPCREEMKGTPIGAYGRTKLHGEEAIQRVGCRHIIIRTSWLYSEYGKNFVKTMLALTASKPSLKVVFDQVGTPTYAGDLAEVIVRFLEIAGSEGDAPSVTEKKADVPSGASPSVSGAIFHFSNEGVCSWYDFARAIAQYAGHTSCEIVPCHSDEFPSKVHRPAYSVLDKTKIKAALGISIPYWTDSLKKCLKTLL